MEKYRVSATILTDDGFATEHDFFTDAKSKDEAVESFIEWLTDKYSNSPDILKCLSKSKWDL